MLETPRLPCNGDLTIDFEPEFFVMRRKFEHRFTCRIAEPGLPDKCRIRFEETVIVRLARLVEQNLDDAEAFIDRSEQVTVLFFRRSQGVLGLALANDVRSLPGEQIKETQLALAGPIMFPPVR